MRVYQAPGRRRRRSSASKPGMQCEASLVLVRALLAALLLLGGHAVPAEATQREVRDSAGLRYAMMDQEVTDIVLLESILVREAEWGDAPVVLRDLAFIGNGTPGVRKKLVLEKGLKKFAISYGWLMFRSLEVHHETVAEKKSIQDKGYYWPRSIEIRSRTAEVAIEAGLPRYPPAGWQGINSHFICAFDQMPAEGEEHCNFTATRGAPAGGLIEIDTVLVMYLPEYLFSLAGGKMDNGGLDIVEAYSMNALIDPTIFDWPISVLYQKATDVFACPALEWAGLAGRGLNTTLIIESVEWLEDAEAVLNAPPWIAPMPSTWEQSGTQPQSTSCQTVKGGVFGKDYVGPISQASFFPKSKVKGHRLVEIEDGPYECLPWKDVSHLPGYDFSHIEGNSCRNPLDLSAAWCFIRSPISVRPVPGSQNFTSPLENALISNVAWAYCDVPICGAGTDDCQYLEDQGVSYRGTMNYTRTGKPCQPWDHAQFSLGGFKGDNYCRNLPKQDDAAFCMVSDFEFEYCDVPICPEPMPVVDMPPVSDSSPPVRGQVTTPAPKTTAAPMSTPAPTMYRGSEQEELGSQPPREINPALVGGILAGCVAAVISIMIGVYIVALRSKQGGDVVEKMSDEETTQLSGNKLPLSDTIIPKNADFGASSVRSHVSSAIRGTTIRSSNVSAVSDAANLSIVSSSPEDLGYVQLEAVLGRGFTAMVWSGRWMGTPCAIKIIEMRSLAKVVRKTILNGIEMTYVRDLSHLHVIRTFHVYQQVNPVHQFGNASMPTHEFTALWLIQELCDKGDLRRCMNEEKLFGNESEERWRNTLIVLRQVMLGLAYLHSQGIIHADLKAENVLLASSGMGRFVAKVADFGMAKNLKGRGTYYTSNGIIGDMAYMAPEAITKKRVSPEIDTYSFGILMYEVASSTSVVRDFDGPARSVEGARPVFPAEIDPSYKELAEQCWQEEPFLRPNDSDILNALDALIGDSKAGDTGMNVEDLAVYSCCENMPATDGYDVPNCVESRVEGHSSLENPLVDAEQLFTHLRRPS